MNIIGKRYWFYLISAVLIIPGVISLIAFGFKPGVEFQSGTTFTTRFSTEIRQDSLRQELSKLGYDEAVIQKSGEGDYIIRTKEISTEAKQALISSLERSLNTTITIRDFFAVSPLVASETGRNAAIVARIPEGRCYRRLLSRVSHQGHADGDRLDPDHEANTPRGGL